MQRLLALSADEAPTHALISAFIKTVRLRMPGEANRFLARLWNRDAKSKAQVKRRLLIGAAEDCMSIPVMQEASRWYAGPARNDFREAVRVVQLIAQTPCWYATEDGRRFIRAYREAKRSISQHRKDSEASLHTTIRSGVDRLDSLVAYRALLALTDRSQFNAQALADLLLRLALEIKSEPAIALARLYADNVRHLWRDRNYCLQALWAMFEGAIGPQDLPTLTVEEIDTATRKALDSLDQALPIPSWCLDGLYTFGSDRRFTGTFEDMAAACSAYEHYGRLSPDDPWLDEFYGHPL